MDIPSWRRAALVHTIGFWESWDQYADLDVEPFCVATHLVWTQYHQRNHWTYTDLTPFVSLAPPQQRKLRAMLSAYRLIRTELR